MILDKKYKWGITSVIISLWLLINHSLLIQFFSIEFSIGKLVLFLIPAIVYVKQPGIFSVRFLYPALLSYILYWISQESYLLFATGIFSVLLALELLWGKLNNFTWIALFLSTTLFKYFFDIFGFNIKVYLTKWAGSVLQLFHTSVEQTGNIIHVDGQSFIVDTACMGLRLTTTSFLLAMVLISLTERKFKKSFETKHIVVLFSLSFLLLIASNFARIITIIEFELPSESAAHMLSGLITLALFHTLPLMVIIKQIGQRLTSSNKIAQNNFVSSRFKLSIPFLLLALNGLGLALKTPSVRTQTKKIKKLEYVENRFGMDCYIGRASLIYIKPPARFYSINHNPFICWRGNGYSVLVETKMDLGDKTIYYGELQNGAEKLYTAWWFDNGANHTNSELEWRWKNFTGDPPYSIVNITAKTKDELFAEVNQLKTNNLFQY